LNAALEEIAYKSAPTYVSRLLTMRFPISLKVLPAKIKNERQMANIIAVLVFLL